MKLYEYEGKQLFKAYDIPLATGWLAEEGPPAADKPVVVKAQVLSGGRGKQGGIISVKENEDLSHAIKDVYRKTIHNEKTVDVYIEEKVAIKRELYMSIIIDRNLKTPVLIVSGEGGVDIEDVPDEDILKIPINPLIGLQPYMIKKASLFLQVPVLKIKDVIRNMWHLFYSEQAELVEINPLFITQNERLIAGDAKVILDNAAGGTPDLSFLPRNRDNFEDKISALDAVGVEMDGDIAIVTSGAGLGLATLDLVKSQKGTARALIDLGGHVIHDVSSARNLINELKKIQPEKFLFNFYFQVASCFTLAEAIAAELGDLHQPVSVRLKGVEEEEAQELLSDYSNIYITNSLTHACENITREAE